MLGSDMLEWQAIDPVITELTTVFSEQMQETLDLVTRTALVAGTNVAYAGTATVRSGVASGANLSWAELRNARRILANANVPTFEDNRYGVLIHPNVVKDLFADTNTVNAFQYAVNRGAAQGGENPLQTGALGDLLGFRFYESSNANIVSGLGQSARDIYQTLFFGRDGYITTELTSDTARTYFKARGTAGPLDPLDQYWSLGWKAAYVAAITDQDRILRYETASSTS
jgi:N4-gp56 family major capsid protein